MFRRERARADLKDLETSDKGQVSKTDPDARLLSKGDQTIAGYNVQSVVDDKHMLIVGSEVVNRSDAGHLHVMAKAVKDALDVKALQVLADEGYYNSEDLKACEDDGITAYVPIHEGNRKPRSRAVSPARTSATMRAPMSIVARPANCCIRQRSPGRMQAAGSRSAI